MDHVDKVAGELYAFAKAHDPRSTPAEARLAVNYLDAFGYLGRELAGWKDISLGDVVNALNVFQHFFGIRQTGQLCARTVRAMEACRCGCPDRVLPGTERGRQALKTVLFAQTNLNRWQKTSLRYCIRQYVINQTAQDQIVKQAFAAWSAVANVRVEPWTPGTSDPCDIVIQVGQGQKDNFDGPGGVLAWCYIPDGSDQQLLMEFDQDETWITDPSQRGILILNVATHEFGHGLGLTHSVVQSALMAPYYNPNIATPQANDDIPRIQARYGPPPTTTPVVPTPPPPVPVPPALPTPAQHLLTVSGPVYLDGKQIA